MLYFLPYLISREQRRDHTGDYIVIQFLRLGASIPAESAESALQKAQSLYPLFPHRLAIGDYHGNSR